METIVKHYHGIEARFSKIARERQVSSWQQFIAIFKRNFVYLLRNPRTLQALFVNVTMTAFVYLCVYFKAGEPDPYNSTTER
jgi:hypothetical protein